MRVEKQYVLSSRLGLRPRSNKIISFTIARTVLLILALFVPFFFSGTVYAADSDSFLENFSEFTKNASIDGTNYWRATGNIADAIVQNSLTFPGSAQALRLIGDQTPVQAGRSTIYFQEQAPLPILYGNVSPVWVRVRVRPANAAQIRDVPANGIAAVTTDPATGHILVNNRRAWVDSGVAFTPGIWTDVLLKLDFGTKTYDLYVFNSTDPSPLFIPKMTGLNFIDSSAATLTNLKLFGGYSQTLDDDVYIDSIAVTYIYRLQAITLPQKLYTGQPSGLITMQLQDFNANPQTAIQDVTLELKSTSSNGKFSLNREPWADITQVVLPKFAQMVSFYYKDTAKGKPIISIREYPEQGWEDGLQEEEIVSEVQAFDVDVLPRQVAGTDFKIKITAKDEQGNVNENYNGNVLLGLDFISPQSGSFKLAPAQLSGFIRGQAEAVISYPDCGIVRITVTDSEYQYQKGYSQQILFLPASFSLAAGFDQVSARPFSLSITAKNSKDQVTPNYNSIVKLDVVPVNPAEVAVPKIIPESIEGTAFTNGRAQPDIAYNLYGTIKIRAEDINDENKSGVTGDIKFIPKGLSLTLLYPPGRAFYYVGEPVVFTVKVQDHGNNPIANYPGVVSMSGSGMGLAVPLDYTFAATDAGQHTFSAETTGSGSYHISAQIEKGAFQAESAEIVVKEAYLQVIDTESPIGTGEVIVQLVDEAGNVITGENNLPITIRTREELDNSSAYVPSGQVVLRNGRAIIPITDAESEVVAIIPSSPFKIKVREGKVTFGPLGRSGINTLMWRELKEGK